MDDGLLHLAQMRPGLEYPGLPICWGKDAKANAVEGRTTLTIDHTEVTCPDCLEWIHA